MFNICLKLGIQYVYNIIANAPSYCYTMQCIGMFTILLLLHIHIVVQCSVRTFILLHSVVYAHHIVAYCSVSRATRRTCTVFNNCCCG